MVNYLKKQILVASCIYLGQVLVGYSAGWSAPVIAKLRDPDQTPLPDVVSDGEASLTGSLVYIGTIIGPYMGGYISNVKGRKPCLFLSGVITLLAFVLLAFARSILMIFAGRILKGAGVGMLTIINVVYIGEIASTNIRGILLTLIGFFHTFGTLLAFSVGPYVPYVWTNWLGAALSTLYIAGICTVPESPVFQILIATIIIGVSQLFSSIITPVFVERSGRKSLLLVSTATCCFSLAVLGVYFQLDDVGHSIVDSIKWLPLVSLIVFFIAYEFGFGIIPSTLMGEMFTSNVRSSGSVFVMTVAWVVGFGVSTAFGYMLPVLGGAVTFWVFSTSCAIAFLFSLFFVPETKGKSLVEISEMLSK